MKKLQAIIICLLYSICVAAQQPPTTHEVMQLTLPNGTEQLNKNQYDNFSKRFRKTMLLKFHDHVYKKNGLLIHYLNLSVPIKMKKSLESDQKLMVSTINQITDDVVDNSRIIIVNDIRFLIIEFHQKDDWYIKFSSDYDKQNRSINGFIEYKKPDEAEAKQYLQELLQNMHFRN